MVFIDLEKATIKNCIKVITFTITASNKDYIFFTDSKVNAFCGRKEITVSRDGNITYFCVFKQVSFWREIVGIYFNILQNSLLY